MIFRFTILSSLFSVILLSSCSRTAKSKEPVKSRSVPKVVRAEPKSLAPDQTLQDDGKTSKPCLYFIRPLQHSFLHDTKATGWTLKGVQLTKVSVRLVRIAGGKIKEESKTAHSWEKATDSKGSILFLKSNGKSFGADKKTTLSLSVTMNDRRPHFVERSNVFVERSNVPIVLNDISTAGSTSGQVGSYQVFPSDRGESIILSSVFVPNGNDPSSLPNSIAEMVKLSKTNEATFIAIAVTCETDPKQ